MGEGEELCFHTCSHLWGESWREGNPMKILVTGGAGFIGSHLVDALVARGEDVLVLDDLSSGKREFVNPKAQFTEVDIRTPEAQTVVRDFHPEVIFHLAAQKSVPESLKHPAEDASINLVGLCNLLEAIPGSELKKFIFVSTGGAMYGDNAKLPAVEDQPANPSSPYGLSKYASERYLHVWSKLHNFQATILRPANVFGPRQDPFGEAGVIAILAKRAVEKQPMRVFGSGKHTRDYVFVADVVQAFLAALDRDATGTFNIGSGVETSVLDIIQNLSSVTGSELPIDRQPEVVGEMERSALHANLARTALQWGPKVALEEGIRQTYEWFRRSS